MGPRLRRGVDTDEQQPNEKATPTKYNKNSPAPAQSVAAGGCVPSLAELARHTSLPAIGRQHHAATNAGRMRAQHAFFSRCQQRGVMPGKDTAAATAAAHHLPSKARHTSFAEQGSAFCILLHWENACVHAFSEPLPARRGYANQNAAAAFCYSRIQISPPLPSLMIRSRVSDSFCREASGICSSLAWMPSPTRS